MTRDAFYEDLLRPLLFQLDPEDAHNLAHKLLRMLRGVLPALPYTYTGTDLTTELAGRKLNNPIGIAAGFDKDAMLTDLLGYLGFGFEEVGSITARPSAGNPRPRLFRLPEDQALINRLGLNGAGAEAVSKRLRAITPSLPLAVNIAKTHDPAISGDKTIEDFLYSFTAIKDLDVIYVALNASCPNTREGCLQEKKELSGVVSEIQKANTSKIPLFIKVSPDSSDQLIDDLLEIGSNFGLAGFICGNTTTTRQSLKTDAQTISSIGQGGLSGPPLKPLALNACRRFAERKSAKQQIIAVGGVRSGADAFEFIRAGATAVELYTGLVFSGPSVAKNICLELSELLRRESCTLKEATGGDLKRNLRAT